MLHHTRAICLSVALLLVIAEDSMAAKPTLAKYFTDHCVIQADQPITVWGTADTGQKVTVQLGTAVKIISANENGQWSALLPARKASYQELNLEVKTESVTIRRQHIVIGEVWLATGQSNMQWMLKQSTGAKQEITDCDDPHLRLLLHVGTLHPGSKKYPRDFLSNLNAENYYQCDGWKTCSAKSAINFSAVAYYFAKRLRKELDVPVGIIALPVGGSPIEAHLPSDAFTGEPKLKPLLKEWWKNPDYPQWCRQRAAHNLTNWLEKPVKGQDPLHPFAPTFLWQAGIKPILPSRIKGVIWYQGESNATADGGSGKAVPKEVNHRKLAALVKAYRRHWKNELLPFYHVQLPGLNRPWTLFREMQLDLTRELKNVGMAVSIDVGHPTNVHPPDKKPVGDRLARLALHGTYGKDIVPNGPLYKRCIFKPGVAMINFEYSKGMRGADGKVLRGFEIAGSDKKFHPAIATVHGDHLKILSQDVPDPEAVRYAWANDPDCNLVNSDGLPASPFRTDSWENTQPTKP